MILEEFQQKYLFLFKLLYFDLIIESKSINVWTKILKLFRIPILDVYTRKALLIQVEEKQKC